VLYRTMMSSSSIVFSSVLQLNLIDLPSAAILPFHRCLEFVLLDLQQYVINEMNVPSSLVLVSLAVSLEFCTVPDSVLPFTTKSAVPL